MVINALNSGAQCFMACLEDASAPTWQVMVEGQINLRDAAHGTIALEDKGKSYKLNDKTAVLMARPRGWHLDEAHMIVDGERVSGAIFDFGLYVFHNAKALLAKGSGPYFYLPKMEHYLEARLWNNIFTTAQSMLNLPLGTIRATVLIETLPAAFMAEEILYELRDHITALNCGRWDYIFSYIKTFRNDRSKLSAGSRRRHHGRAVHGRLCRPCRPHLPQARRPCDGRHERLHPGEGRRSRQ